MISKRKEKTTIMPALPPYRTISTESGTLAYLDTGSPSGTPDDPSKSTNATTLLLLHGNSTSARIFTYQLTSPKLVSRHRLLAFDLPGHGQSANAPTDQQDETLKATYTMSSYAQAALSLLQALSHPKTTPLAILGWSLGGHIGIELIPLLASSGYQLRGVMLTGTPPGTGQGFRIDIARAFAGREKLEPGDVQAFAQATVGDAVWEREQGFPAGRREAWIAEGVERTDGRARRVMIGAFVGGEGVDQRAVVEGRYHRPGYDAASDVEGSAGAGAGVVGEGVVVAVVNGAEEPFVDLDYLDQIKWARLWEGKCHRLPGLEHAPFWEDPDTFNAILERFLASVG